MTFQPTCFALLDDAHSQDGQSRLYTQLIDTITLLPEQGWSHFLSQVQQALDSGAYLVALLAYESGLQIHALNKKDDLLDRQTYSKFLVFSHCQMLDQDQVEAFLQSCSKSESVGLVDLKASVTKQEFIQAIEKIQNYIQAGDTYQVNFTYRLHFKVLGSPINLYQVLRQRQPVPYGALICLPNGDAVLSLSPELFMRHEKGHLFAKPMKGTAAATGEADKDRQIALSLSLDEKNRAENLMIVDLLRNDLGRVAKTGTVKVNKLFDVQRFSSVLQMTSDISAELKPNTSLPEIFYAMYPCGSITGAPKIRTMEIIQEVESEKRGFYTGAIGWFDPSGNKEVLGDFCMSVPIRTLTLTNQNELGVREGVMGVGAGIVFDSVAQEEYEECQLKARFLTGLQASFHLIETMQASKAQGCRHLALHLQRLQASAQRLHFVFDEERIKNLIQQSCANLPTESSVRLKLTLMPNGEIDVQHGELVALPEVVTVIWSKTPCSIPALLLAHKTSWRAEYDKAWQAAEKVGAFDAIFVNENGYVTEGGRSNIFIRHHNQWKTPPLSDGILPGVMRAIILQDEKWNAIEEHITVDDVLEAQEIVLCNSLRGIIKAKFEK